MSQNLTVIKNYRADAGCAVRPFGGHWTVLHFLIIFPFPVFRPMNLSVTCDNFLVCIRESMNCIPLWYWRCESNFAEECNGRFPLRPRFSTQSQILTAQESAPLSPTTSR